jgi:2-polyprenyl-3-methyl-5-hydroxy-6-metoxy-1,4-benzoquinol methylase
MMQTAERIQEDFDRIALLTEEHGWSHNDHYHGFLLKHVPPRRRWALDVGCGTGAFSRALARRSDHVLGIDLSPQMVRVAKERSRGLSNVAYETADVMTWDFPTEKFNCIASIATLHHLPLGTMLEKMRDSLAPGGVLLVLDIYRAESAADLAVSAAAVPVNLLLRLVKARRLREPLEIRQAWEEHGRTDSYPTLSQVRRACAAHLPGAKITRHLLWRYSIVWKKPGC